MIRAVLFDLDGLLVDSEPAWFRARTELVEAAGGTWTEKDQRAMGGVHTEVWVEAVGRAARGTLTPKEAMEGILSRMEGYYRAGEVPPLAGAHGALRDCCARYRVGLASGSPRRLIDAALTGLGWGGFFEDMLSSDETGRGKPAPDVYLALMERMGLEAGTTAVVEDSGAGIRAGRDAGCYVVAVPNRLTHPGPEKLAVADVVIESLEQLASALAHCP